MPKYDPIGEVMKLLQEHQLATSAEQSILEEQYAQGGQTGPHGCSVRLKRSAEALVCPAGTRVRSWPRRSLTTSPIRMSAYTRP